MTDDRELLELAAKADGRTLRYNSIGTQDARCAWNPLDDDGDALRLAVKLRMDITFDTIDVFAFPPDGRCGCSESLNVDDPCAATRRAIVRAAAEIGLSMQDED